MVCRILLLFSIYFALASSTFVDDCPTYSDYVLGRERRCNKRDGHKNPRVLNGLTVAQCKQECDDSPNCGYFFVSSTQCRLMRGCAAGRPTLNAHSRGFCAYVAKPVNCEGSWSDYGECSNECGAGTQSRTFSITQPAQYYGNQCNHSDGETESQACGPPETDCCDSIVMDGSAFTHSNTNRDGTYVKQDGISRDGFPVYKKSNGQYLFYVCPRGWAIGNNYNSLTVGLVSEDGGRGCPNEFSSWSFAPFGSSNLEPSVSAKCAGAEEKVSLWGRGSLASDIREELARKPKKPKKSSHKLSATMAMMTERKGAEEKVSLWGRGSLASDIRKDLTLDVGEDWTLSDGEDFTVARKPKEAQISQTRFSRRANVPTKMPTNMPNNMPTNTPTIMRTRMPTLRSEALTATIISETFAVYGLAFVGLISTLIFLQSAFRRYISDYKTIDEATKLEEMSA